MTIGAKERKRFLLLFGTAVKEKRLMLGLSQEELGFHANLDRTYISGIERGTRNPTITSAQMIAKALNLSLAKLFSSLEG
ncbi:MAG: helix-turn-helix transcriptional regulator [Nitrospinae bacterium]|nr:helix-turn-helix transcriptional regulator [Nitrospinota bacterium]